MSSYVSLSVTFLVIEFVCMLLSCDFNFVCRFGSQGSFTISCNSSQRIDFFKIQ